MANIQAASSQPSSTFKYTSEKQEAVDSLNQLLSIKVHLRGDVDVAARFARISAYRIPSLWTIPTTTAKYLSSLFSYVADRVLTYPKTVIAIAVVLFAVCTVGFMMFQERVFEAEELWNPTDMPGYKSMTRAKATFPPTPKTQQIIFYKNGQDILTKTFLLALASVHDRANTEWKYLEMCAKPVSWAPCQQLSLLKAWNYSRGAIESDPDLIGTVLRFKNETDARQGMAVAVGSDAVTQEPILLATIESWAYDRKHADDYYSIETDIIDFVHDAWPGLETGGVLAEVTCSTSFDRELQSILDRDIMLIIISIVLIIGFCAVVLGDMTLVGSRILLGTAGSVIMLSSYVMGVGILCYCTVPTTPVTPLIMFVLVGIGVDDIFIIVDCYQMNMNYASLKKRMMKSLSSAGPAITLTTVSDICAFGVGSTATMPGVRSFTIAALVVLTVNFLMQVTVFVVCLHWDELRVVANRMDLVCCIVLPDRYTTVKEFLCGGAEKAPLVEADENAIPVNPVLLSLPDQRRMSVEELRRVSLARPIAVSAAGGVQKEDLILGGAQLEAPKTMRRRKSCLNGAAISPMQFMGPNLEDSLLSSQSSMNLESSQNSKSASPAVPPSNAPAVVLTVPSNPLKAPEKRDNSDGNAVCAANNGKELDAVSLGEDDDVQSPIKTARVHKKDEESEGEGIVVPIVPAPNEPQPAPRPVPVPVVPRRHSSRSNMSSITSAAPGVPKEDDNMTRRAIDKYYAPLITSQVGKWCVVAFFIAWAGLSVSWYPKVGEGIGRDETLPADSYVNKMSKLQENYFANIPSLLTVVVDNASVDYTDPALLDTVTQLKVALEADDSISAMPIWLLNFAGWRRATYGVSPSDVTYRTQFYRHLVTFLDEVPVLIPSIVWADEEKTHIAVTRFVGFQRYVEKSADRITDMKNTRAIVSEWAANFSQGDSVYLSSAWHPFADANVVIRKTVFETLLFAVLAILCVLLLFMPPLMAFFVTLQVALIDNALLGFMYILGIKFSAVSYIVIAMSVGLSVDYCAHIGIAFTNCRLHESEELKGKDFRTAPEYAREALHEIGASVLSGGFSTLLGVSALGFASSETFLLFFKLLFTSVLFGMLHGFILLPAFLACLPRPLMRHLVLPPV